MGVNGMLTASDSQLLPSEASVSDGWITPLLDTRHRVHINLWPIVVFLI